MARQLPEWEVLRRAILWISNQRELDQKPPLIELINQAGCQFDLSPKDCDFLIHFFTQPQEPQGLG